MILQISRAAAPVFFPAIFICAALVMAGCAEVDATRALSPDNPDPLPASQPEAQPDPQPSTDPEKVIPTPPISNPEKDKDQQEPEPTPVNLGAGTLAPLIPLSPEPEAPGRLRRRMDIDQLDQAVRTVTGGIGWTSDDGVNNFTALAGSMGKPDFLNSVIEDLSPSPLFQKFLEDASRDVCQKLMALELEQEAEEPILFTFITPDISPFEDPDAVDANLRALLLRFHGRVLPAGSPGLEHWKWLINSSYLITKDPALAWRTVCVGLFVHPDFYSY